MNARAADYVLPLSVQAEMARAGLHDLRPYWSPDAERTLDPLDDRETRAAVRAFLGRLWAESRKADRRTK